MKWSGAFVFQVSPNSAPCCATKAAEISVSLFWRLKYKVKALGTRGSSESCEEKSAPHLICGYLGSWMQHSVYTHSFLYHPSLSVSLLIFPFDKDT